MSGSVSGPGCNSPGLLGDSGSLGKIPINRSIKLLEGVRKTFVMATGIISKRPDIRCEQGRIPNQELIRLIAVTEPEIIWMF
jgi:hypothetical protein